MKDPVCGMQVDERTAAGSADYHGTRYWFCSNQCEATFRGAPEKYVGGASSVPCHNGLHHVHHAAQEAALSTPDQTVPAHAAKVLEGSIYNLSDAP